MSAVWRAGLAGLLVIVYTGASWAKSKGCGGDVNAMAGCGTNCGKLCSDIGKTDICCSLDCIPDGCDCKFGFYFSEDMQKCVKQEDCPTPKCTGPNEQYLKCGTACPATCQNKDVPSICVDVCTSGCFCTTGYVRNDKGVCIPSADCPASNAKCGANEEYVPSVSGVCRPQSCQELGVALNCPTGVKDPGCVCTDGYVRNESGDCIPKDQCPSCGGDPNAVSGCGTNCGKKCTDLKMLGICPLFCNANGCDCKDGFYYDDKKMKCVPKAKCLKTKSKTKCKKPNEIYVDCPNAICKPKSCADLNHFLPLAPPPCLPPLFPCVGGCICKDGYLYDDKGNCVPQNQCVPTCPANEEYNFCGPTCPEPTCDYPYHTYCPSKECKAGCFCQVGTVRNDVNECVPEDECNDDDSYEDSDEDDDDDDDDEDDDEWK